MAMTSQFVAKTSSLHFFWHCFVSLVKFSYWCKFHVNIITGFVVMATFFYKALTRNPEIRNTPVWVFPNIWRLGKLGIPNLAQMSVRKWYWMLQNAKVAAFTVSELLWENQQGVKLPPQELLLTTLCTWSLNE